MKKIFTLSALCLLSAASVSAAPSFAAQETGKIDVREAQVSHSISPKEIPGYKALKASANAPEIITTPTGDRKWYWMNGAGTYPLGDGEIRWHTMTDGAAAIWFNDDNTVYIKDFLEIEEPIDLGITTYLKGVREGNEIVVSLPQTIIELDASADIYISVQAFEITDEGYMPDESVTEMRFSINDETGFIDWKGFGEDRGVAMFYTGDNMFSGWWTGYSIDYKNYKPNDVTLVEVPEGAKEMPYLCLLDESIDYMFNITAYQHGYDYYFKGLNVDYPYLTVKGTMDGPVLSIPSREFIGTARYCFVYTGAQNPTTGAINPEYSFIQDPKTGNFSSLDQSYFGMGLFVTMGMSGNQVFLPIISYINFDLIYMADVSGTPANPYGLAYTDDYIDYDMHSFWFDLPMKSTSGNYLFTDWMYYTVYRNGEPIEFIYNKNMMGDYSGVNTRTTELPYNLNNGWDIATVSVEHHIGIYDIYTSDPTQTLGVVSLYRNEQDGSFTASKVVTLNVRTGQTSTEDYAGVGSPMASDIVDVEYFDLNGRKVANPGEGIYVQRLHYSDGTVRSLKAARR